MLQHLFLLLPVLMLIPSGNFQPQNCGVVQKTGWNRVVGGANVNNKTYPWYVALTIGSNNEISVACGGTLIAPKFILTAAHCYAEYPKSKWTKLYKLMYYLVNQCEPGANVLKEPQPSKVEIHKRYRISTLSYDIALITLPTKATPIPICLPSPNLKLTTGEIVGFGSDLPRIASRYPCELQEATIPILSKKQCVKTDIGPTIRFLNRIICAGKPEGGVDTCDGDSGGPLQVDVNGRYAIAGIVSFGYGCARKGMPGVYTDVSSYLDWILPRVRERAIAPLKPLFSFSSLFNFTKHKN